MNHFIASAFLVFICTLGAGIYFVLGRRSAAERFFGFFWLGVAFWTLFVSAQFYLLKWLSGFVWGWWLHIGCIFVPVLFLHFALHLAGHLQVRPPHPFLSPLRGERIRVRGDSFALKLAYSFAIFFVILNTFTDWFTQETIYRDAYAYPKPGILYPFYILFFQVIGFWTAFLLFKWGSALPPERRGILYLFLTVHIMAYVGSMDNYLIMYDLQIFPLYPYGLYLILPYVFLGSYAVHRLATKRLNASDSTP